MVQIEFDRLIVSEQYGACGPGDVVRCDEDFARHCVITLGAARYVHPAHAPKQSVPETKQSAVLTSRTIDMSTLPTPTHNPTPMPPPMPSPGQQPAQRPSDPPPTMPTPSPTQQPIIQPSPMPSQTMRQSREDEHGHKTRTKRYAAGRY